MRRSRLSAALGQRYLKLEELANDAFASPERGRWVEVRDTAWQLIKDCLPVLSVSPHAAVVALAAAVIVVVPEVTAGNWLRAVAAGWVIAAAVAALDLATTSSPRPMDAVARDLYRRAELVAYAAHRAGAPAAALLAENLTSIRLGNRSLHRSTSTLLDRSRRELRQVARTQRTQLRSARKPFDFDGAPEELNAWFEQQIRSDFQLIDRDRIGARLTLTGATSMPLEAMRLTGRSLLYLCAGPQGGAAVLFDTSALDEPGRPLASSVELPRFDLATVDRTVTALHEIAARRRAGQVTGTELTDHVERLLTAIGETVWAPILKAWPHLRTHSLSIVPMGETTQLPLYTALVEGQPACVLVDVTIAPSARSLVLAGEHPAADGPVFVAADPATGDDEISQVVTEANLVANVYGVTPHIVREPNSVSDHDARLRSLSHHPHGSALSPTLLPQLRSSAVIHLACHGSIRPQKPLESALLLGGTITVESLIAEDLRSGCLIVLSACDLAGIGTEAPGEQLSFPAVLLAGGARSVVAALWPVPDTRRTAGLMKQFHQELKASSSPSRALAAAIRQAREAGAPAPLWAPFVCFGT